MQEPNIQNLEQELIRLKQQRESRLRYQRPDGIWAMNGAYLRSQEHRELHEKILAMEREICVIQGSEYAVPTPYLVGGVFGTALVASSDFAAGIATGEGSGLCLFFRKQDGVRLEAINDEVIYGHPLYGKGLDYWGSYLVENSRWKTMVQSAHAVHSQYDESRWLGLKHHLFVFKDRMFEVLSDVEPECHAMPTYSEAANYLLGEVKASARVKD